MHRHTHTNTHTHTPFYATQDHGLETGLDVHLIPMCQAALVDKVEDVEPVYLEMEVQNTHR